VLTGLKLMKRTEMVVETWVYLPFNHMTRLLTQAYFAKLIRPENSGFYSYPLLL
jgi:hypothetical protein